MSGLGAWRQMGGHHDCKSASFPHPLWSQGRAQFPPPASAPSAPGPAQLGLHLPAQPLAVAPLWPCPAAHPVEWAEAGRAPGWRWGA